MTKLAVPRHQAPRRHPLLRARPRAVAAVLHRQARLRRDLAHRRPSSSSAAASARRASRPATSGRVQRAGRRAGGRAARFLSKHPDGVGTLIFEVEDIDADVRAARGARRHADRRHRRRSTDDGGTLRQFSITTPFGDCTFRFRERRGYRGAVPRRGPASTAAAANRFGFEQIDHVTSNFQTMKPMLLWLEHVLGFEQMWEVAFHTSDVDPGRKTGSGLKSIVMWDPASQTRSSRTTSRRGRSSRARRSTSSTRSCAATACSTSRSPSATSSRAVRGLRGAGVTFMPTPGSYYDMLPERIAKQRHREDRRGPRDPARARDPGRRRSPPRVHAADLPQGVGGPVRRRERGPVLLRDHPAQGRSRLRRRQLPRAVREHRARAAASEGASDARSDAASATSRASTTSSCAAPTASCATRSASRATASTVRTRSSITCAGRTRSALAPADARLGRAGRRRATARSRSATTRPASSPAHGGPQIDARVAAAVQRRPDRRRRVPDRATIRSTSPTATPIS